MATFIKTGFWERAQKGYDHWLNLDLLIKRVGSETFLIDAPEDGLQYARQDGEWTIVTGGGGSQDLQQTLVNGTSASFEGTSFLKLLDGDPNERSFGADVYNEGLILGSSIEANINQARIQNQSTNLSIEGALGAIQINSGLITIDQTKTNSELENLTTRVQFIEPVSNTTLSFPAKSEGEYTLATTDDITLQKTLQNGSEAEFINKDFVITLGDNDVNVNSANIHITGFSGTEDISSARLQSNFEETEGRFVTEGGKVLIDQLANSSTTSISITDPTANQAYLFPNKSAGTYTLATLEDITLQTAVDNKGEYVSNYSGGTQRLKFFDYDGDRDPNFQISTSNDSFEANIDVTPSSVQINGTKFNPEDSEDYIVSNISIIDGGIRFVTSNFNYNTEIYVPNPTVASSVINFPSPTINDTYTLATTDDLTPVINLVPDGDFTIPDGSRVRMVTLKDTDPQIVTLPAIADAIGVIYFIKNGSSGTVDINSKLGGNDIWEGGVPVATANVPIGSVLRMTNDGEYFNVL
jgi:hypothetical protein